MEKGGAIYIMTNRSHSTLYIGVTSDLIVRVQQHKNFHDPKSFASKYNCTKLVYYEAYHSIEEAISREKQLKSGSRKRKVELIESKNPNWIDLFESEVSKW